jgi:hypothetical protein
MTEFYIETNSFAAPFFSDSSHTYVEANSAADALEKTAAAYSHPARLYAAAAYTSSDARNKGEKPLARWLCNKALAMDGRLGTVRSDHPGHIEHNGETITVDDPFGGRVLA